MPRRLPAYLAWGLVLFLSACEAGGSTETNVPGTTAQATTTAVEPTTTAGPTTTSGPERWRTDLRVSGYQAGTYWWDPANDVFLHNPTDESVGVGLSIGPSPPDGACVTIDFACTPLAERETAPTALAGHEGIYWQSVVSRCEPEPGMKCVDVRTEVWEIAIEDTKVTILLFAEPDVTDAELAEGHAIVDSIRIEPWDNEAGFRMIFTIPDGWDSA